MKDPEAVTFKTQTGMARCLGIDRVTVHGWTHKPGFPGGSKGPWELPKLVKWLTDRQKVVAVDDPLMVDSGESPGLERYRLAKAAITELQLSEMTGTLISAAKIRAMLTILAGLLRGLGEKLAKRFGPDAARMTNDTLLNFTRVVEHELGDEGTIDDSSEA